MVIPNPKVIQNLGGTSVVAEKIKEEHEGTVHPRYKVPRGLHKVLPDIKNIFMAPKFEVLMYRV